MQKLIAAVVVILCFTGYDSAFAQGVKNQSKASLILKAEGESCLGQKHSREETVRLAHAAAKRIAAENAMSYVSSETRVKDGNLRADIIASYSKATTRVLETLKKEWYQTQPETGYVDFCYRVKLKVEVIPIASEPQQGGRQKPVPMSPKAPLTVELWTDRDIYRVGDSMTFFFKGNKPFYAHAVYQDASGSLIQVTPHQHPRQYEGGVIYQIPDSLDEFALKVTPPLGDERLILYTSTKPIAGYTGQSSGGVLAINPTTRPLDVTTRGLTDLQGNSQAGRTDDNAEFAEVIADVRVEK